MEGVDIGLRVEHRQRLGLHLGQSTGGLDAGRSAAHDDCGEPLVRVLIGGDQLQAGEDDVAHLERLGAGARAATRASVVARAATQATFRQLPDLRSP